MPIPIQRVTTYPSGIHRFLAYDTSNTTLEGLSSSIPYETLKISNDRVYTSNITILGNVEFGAAPSILRQRLQVNPLRQIFYVSTSTCNEFVMTTEGIYGAAASNVAVFVNQSLLMNYSPTYQDYDVTYSIIGSPASTEYKITLTNPALFGDFVDITVWPQLIQESTPQQGYVYQQVNVSYFRQTGSDIYYNGNVGIGTSNVELAKLVVGGHIFPASNLAYDLGSSNYRFRDIYLSGNTIDLGGTRISRDDNTGGMKIVSSVTNEPLDLQAKHLYVSSNVFTSNVIVYGNIKFNNISLKNNVQVNPVRKVFFVDTSSQTDFILSSEGYYGAVASNVQVFVDHTLLSSYSSNYTDYTMSLLYTPNTTQYTISLTTPAVYGCYVDITVWPQLLPESSPQGFLYQQVNLDANQFTAFQNTGSAIYYMNGNVGIGTNVPLSQLDVVGNIRCSNISVIGDFVTLNTVTSNTEQMVIENAGTGPALKVTQTGNNSVAEFYDKETGVALFVGDGGNVGIGTTVPLNKFHIAGSLSNVVVDSKGYVGMGTTIPIQPIHVEGNIYLNGNISAGNMALFRNKLINGNFDVWQRGTPISITATNTYTADQWSTIYDGTGSTRTVSRQAFTLGQTEVPNEPTYFARYNQSVAGTGGTFSTFENRIESVRTFANQIVTTSFYAKANTTISGFNLIFRQNFGTGGSPSATTYTQSDAFSLTSTWTKYQYTLTIPSISGKTLGANSNDFLGMYLSLPLNTTFTVDLAQVQVEKGNIATPFELRPYGMELQLCQRYYDIYDKLSGTMAYSTIIGMSASSVFLYRCPKRTTPSSITLTTGTALTSSSQLSGMTFNVNNTGYSIDSINGFQITISGNYIFFSNIKATIVAEL